MLYGCRIGTCRGLQGSERARHVVLLCDPEKPALFVVSGTSGTRPFGSIFLNEFAKSSAWRLALYARSARTLKDRYMIDEAREFAGPHANFTSTPASSEALDEDCWEAASGVVHQAVITDSPDVCPIGRYRCLPGRR